MRRALALWLLLFGVYAATLGLSDHSGDEPHYLLAAESLRDDGDVDVTDEYAARAYADFYPGALHPRGHRTKGRLNEPYGVGFPLLILPAYTLGGAKGVELFLAALAALALTLAYRLALRAAPDPWALGAATVAGLSAPLLAYSTAVYPELSAGAALAGAALLALRLEARPGWPPAFACFALLGALPWLGVRFVPAGAVIGVFAARALWRSRRRTLTIGSVEVALFSVALCVGINEALYNGPTPYSAAETGTGASFPVGYIERVPRAATLLFDPGYGLLRWAPLFALAFAGLWWLWRSRRDRLARAVLQLHEIEVTAGLCAAVLAVQVGVAVLLATTASGPWFAGRHLIPALPLAVPLVALGLRRIPRAGVALAFVTVAVSVWLYVDARWGGGSLT
ncbi:MAG: hypothetical protein QOI45_2609 [Thermoleophilaceae bacterium]|jgi:hypothetical protein|nr:hypothetical protein [Thermoleophilaceae bacterium]